MKRSLLIWAVAAVVAVALYAGDYADQVKNLGESHLSSAAYEKLAEAGGDAFEDLMDGLKQKPDAEGVDAKEAAKRSVRRTACARLLGAVGDTRASTELVTLLESQAVETPKYPLLGGACAAALGRIWADKDASDERKQVAANLRLHAADAKLDNRLRWGCLIGLAALRDGGDEADGVMTDAKAPQLLRSAAIAVVVACQRKASEDALLDIWETQRLGPKGDDGKRAGAVSRDYTKPLGMQALFGLAALGDPRAVSGLVDVATMNEFSGYTALRDEAVRLMKQDALKAGAVKALVETFKAVDKPTQRQRSASTLGDFGAVGVTAFLDVADDAPPKPKEGESPDKYPADYYAKQVDNNLSSLRSDEALEAFVEAYGDLPAESKELRGKIIGHLLNNRNALKDKSIEVFEKAADDASIEAPKRAQAINAWAEAKGKESFDDLARWVKSDDGVIRAQAVQNLGRSYIPLAKSKPLLEEALKDKDSKFAKARQNALQGLQRSDDKDLLSLFTDSLDPKKEVSPDVRNTALNALNVYRRTAHIEDDEVFPAIKGRLDDPSDLVRGTAVRVASTMAQVMGNKTDTVEIVQKALEDNSKDVRLQGYNQVSLVPADIDAGKLMHAALLEDTRDLQGNAVVALSKLDSFGTDNDQQKRVVDLALKVLDTHMHEREARDLLGKLGQEKLFNYTSDAIRKRIQDATGGDKPDYTKVPSLIDTLIQIKDLTYFKQVEKLAKQPNVQMRRACIRYIKAFGTRADVGFLRELDGLQDVASPAVKPEIDAAIAAIKDK